MKKLLLIIISLILSSTLLLGVAHGADKDPAEAEKFVKCTKDSECPGDDIKCLEGYCINVKDIMFYRPDAVPEVQALPDVTQENLFKTIFKTILGASMIITIAAIVVAAVFYIISQGNDEDISKAKNIILYLIIGLVIMAAAYGLVSGVIQFDFFKASS